MVSHIKVAVSILSFLVTEGEQANHRQTLPLSIWVWLDVSLVIIRLLAWILEYLNTWILEYLRRKQRLTPPPQLLLQLRQEPQLPQDASTASEGRGWTVFNEKKDRLWKQNSFTKNHQRAKNPELHNNFTTIFTDDSCSFIGTTVILTVMGTIEEGCFISNARNVVHREGGWDCSKARLNSGEPIIISQHPANFKSHINNY